MRWKLEDLPGLFLHLPHAVQDLIHHEDDELVEKSQPSLLLAPPEEERRHQVEELRRTLASPPPLVGLPPPPQDTKETEPESLNINKSIDPMMRGSSQNFELLIQDYLRQLPDIKANSHEAQRLIEHWRAILQDQPKRLAAAKQGYLDTTEAKQFWQTHLSKFHGEDFLKDMTFMEAWEDWQKSAGTHQHSLHPAKKGRDKANQWQDLVIRTRNHLYSVARNRNLERGREL